MRNWRLGTLLAVAGSLVAASAPFGFASTSSTTQATHVDLRWSQTFKPRGAPLAVAKAPDKSLLRVATLDSFDGFELTRTSRQGPHIWSRTWRGPGGSFRGVNANALAVSRANHAVLVAGQATCLFQGESPGSPGPVFVRSYDLGGDLRWTRWVGDCPTRSNHRHVRALSVAGLDVWSGGLAVAFTQGHSSDCCPHFRRGHVVAFGFDGTALWRTELNFPRRTVKEVVTSDVAAAGQLLVVSGSIIRNRYGSNAYLVALSTDRGNVKWRQVTNGKTEPNNDQYLDLDATNGAIFASGTVDDVFEGGGGRHIIERWSTSGLREWRASVPSNATVAAQSDHSVLWSGPVSRQGKPDQIAFGQQRASGSTGWRDRWTLPRRTYPYDYSFVAWKEQGFSTAEVAGPNKKWFLQTWAWRW